MKILLPVLLTVLAGGAAFATHEAPALRQAGKEPTGASHSATARPVLVELYQSQGCSSCPPANANLNAIAGRPDVVALSFGVTYWDQLGWKDSFAKPQFTERQWEYARFNHRANVATPQIWVNGRETIVGSNAAELGSLIAHAARSGPSLTSVHGQVRISQAVAPRGGADVWLARFDPRTVQVAIRAGENGGRTLPHKNIVRSLVQVGHWSGQAQAIDLPRSSDGLATAIFLQAGKGGPVLSAIKV